MAGPVQSHAGKQPVSDEGHPYMHDPGAEREQCLDADSQGRRRSQCNLDIRKVVVVITHNKCERERNRLRNVENLLDAATHSLGEAEIPMSAASPNRCVEPAVSLPEASSAVTKSPG